MPFLAAKGYETYSISLRGTSGTLIPDTEVRGLGVWCLPCPGLDMLGCELSPFGAGSGAGAAAAVNFE